MCVCSWEGEGCTCVGVAGRERGVHVCVWLGGRGVYMCVCSWEGEGCTCVGVCEGNGCWKLTAVCVCICRCANTFCMR